VADGKPRLWGIVLKNLNTGCPFRDYNNPEVGCWHPAHPEFGNGAATCDYDMCPIKDRPGATAYMVIKDDRVYCIDSDGKAAMDVYRMVGGKIAEVEIKIVRYLDVGDVDDGGDVDETQ